MLSWQQHIPTTFETPPSSERWLQYRYFVPLLTKNLLLRVSFVKFRNFAHYLNLTFFQSLVSCVGLLCPAKRAQATVPASSQVCCGCLRGDQSACPLIFLTLSLNKRQGWKKTLLKQQWQLKSAQISGDSGFFSFACWPLIRQAPWGLAGPGLGGETR